MDRPDQVSEPAALAAEVASMTLLSRLHLTSRGCDLCPLSQLRIGRREMYHWHGFHICVGNKQKKLILGAIILFSDSTLVMG